MGRACTPVGNFCNAYHDAVLRGGVSLPCPSRPTFVCHVWCLRGGVQAAACLRFVPCLLVFRRRDSLKVGAAPARVPIFVVSPLLCRPRSVTTRADPYYQLDMACTVPPRVRVCLKTPQAGLSVPAMRPLCRRTCYE